MTHNVGGRAACRTLMEMIFQQNHMIANVSIALLSTRGYFSSRLSVSLLHQFGPWNFTSPNAANHICFVFLPREYAPRLFLYAIYEFLHSQTCVTSLYAARRYFRADTCYRANIEWKKLRNTQSVDCIRRLFIVFEFIKCSIYIRFLLHSPFLVSRTIAEPLKPYKRWIQ